MDDPTKPIDYDALAQQAGAIDQNSEPANPTGAQPTSTDRVHFRDSQEGKLHSVPKEHFSAAKAVDPNLTWVPHPDDPLVRVQTSDGQDLHIHAEDLVEAKKRDPNMKVDYDGLAQLAGGSTPAFAQPGAYQQRKGGSIQNV